MSNQTNIFNGLKQGVALCSVLCALFCMPLSARAAADTSCDNDNNEYINQRLALCSVHAYNIGEPHNPSTPDRKQVMNDVIALKTTIMTQQMKKQYDFLDTTIKRIKTQLEKAILVSKMEAAGATSEGSSATASTNKNIPLSGAQDCNTVYSNSDLLTCLGNNLNLITSATDKTNARKQLTTDVELFNALASADNKTTKCASLSASTMNDCITEYRIKIRSQTSASSQQAQRQQFQNQYN